MIYKEHMTTIEKLERLVREKNANTSVNPIGGITIGLSVSMCDVTYYRAPTLTEAVDKAYEAAFPTRKLEPGDLFVCKDVGGIYLAPADRTSNTARNAVSGGGYSLSELTRGGYTIIGKALDEVIEVKP
jgi:hypothetical protein